MKRKAMSNTVRNIIAVVIGIIVGGAINMGIITIGPSIIPNPVGYDNSSAEAMAQTFHLLQTKHFITPWLAHALGTLAGALVAVKIAASNHLKLALFIGAFFLLGGIMMVVSLPSTPIWFIIADLVGAYLPMAWLGHKLGKS